MLKPSDGYHQLKEDKTNKPKVRSRSPTNRSPPRLKVNYQRDYNCTFP